MAARIKKGDTVVVITGRDKGRSGEVIEMRRDEGRVLVRGVNMVKRHQRQSAVAGGRHHFQRGADPPVERGADRSEGRQADPGRVQIRRQGRGAKESARRQALGS